MKVFPLKIILHRSNNSQNQLQKDQSNPTSSTNDYCNESFFIVFKNKLVQTKKINKFKIFDIMKFNSIGNKHRFEFQKIVIE